jgi:hypothetical protein
MTMLTVSLGLVLLALTASLTPSLTAAAGATDSFLVKFDVNLARGKRGSFVLEVHPAWAPLGVERFREIVNENVSGVISVCCVCVCVSE